MEFALGVLGFGISTPYTSRLERRQVHLFALLESALVTGAGAITAELVTSRWERKAPG